MSMMPPPQNNNSGHRRCRRRRFSRTITVPMTPIYVLVAVTAILALAPPKSLFVMAGNDDDAANDDADNNYNNAPASYDDVYSSSYANANNPYASDGSILYWTEFALFPKRCVNWNGIDQIKYDMYEKSSKHCSDTPLGTYLTPVPTFVNAYLSQLAFNAQDGGYDDYEAPVNAATYATCTAGPVINGVQHYLQVGCAENNPLALAVNYYSDNTCQTASKISDGSGSSYNNNYDIQLDINLPFQKCTPCVIWMDKNDDEVDDQYYVNKQTYAPLCTSVWNYKEECNGKCQKKTKYNVREGWNRADKVLLTILSFFGFGMLIGILTKRRKMSQKDALMEQAAMSAAGLQQSHIIGIFALVIVIITIFGLLALKKITWALLLILNIVLFAYLMKLTVDGSVKETVVGPDGKILEDVDSDEDETSVDETSVEGYQNPSLPVLKEAELPEIS